MDEMKPWAKARAQTPQKGRSYSFFAAKTTNSCSLMCGGLGEYCTRTILL